MTKRYTAADFANARFAEHPDGRTAMWVTGDYGDGEWHSPDDVFDDEEMATEGGWVPVQTKPQITESQMVKVYGAAVEEMAVFQYALESVGIEVIPDQEPTDEELLAGIIRNIDDWQSITSPELLAKYLNTAGVTAPNVKGN